MPESPVPQVAREAFNEVGLSGCSNHVAPVEELPDEVRERLALRIELIKARINLKSLRPPVADSGIGPQGDPRGSAGR